MPADDRLFNPDRFVAVVHGVYVALPMAGDAEAQRTYTDHVLEGARSALREAERFQSPAWSLELLAGTQHSAPWRPGPGALSARMWIRTMFLRYVDALVVVLHRESTGCGKELGFALALGIPTLVLVPAGITPGVHVGSDGSEGRMDRRDYRPGGLQEALTSWLASERDRIEHHHRRRSAWLEAAEPIRLATWNAWSALSAAQRLDVAGHAFLDASQLARLLNDPYEFAARFGALTRFAEITGLRPPELPDGQLAVFEPGELDALREASELWAWSAADAVEAVRAGSELKATAGAMRGRLSTPRGWHDVLRRARVRNRRSRG